MTPSFTLFVKSDIPTFVFAQKFGYVQVRDKTFERSNTDTLAFLGTTHKIGMVRINNPLRVAPLSKIGIFKTLTRTKVVETTSLTNIVYGRVRGFANKSVRDTFGKFVGTTLSNENGSKLKIFLGSKKILLKSFAMLNSV